MRAQTLEAKRLPAFPHRPDCRSPGGLDASFFARAARDDDGMSTAEYAVGTVAACGFAGLLLKLLTSPQVLELLTGIVTKALKLPL